MDSTVDGDHSAGKVPEPYLFKAGATHHFRQFFLRRMLADALGQVSVTFFVSCNQFTQYRQDTEGDENYKLYSLNIESKEPICLTDFENSNTSIIDSYAKDPNEIIIGLNKRNPECSDVYRLNILTGELIMIAQNPGDVRSWMVDNDGVVRIAYAGNVLYRKDEKSDFG